MLDRHVLHKGVEYVTARVIVLQYASLTTPGLTLPYMDSSYQTIVSM